MSQSPSLPTNQRDNSDVFFDAPPHQPNSSKRRYRPADLQRLDVTPSRVDRIRDIYEEAAHNLASTPPPTGHTIRHANVSASADPSTAPAVRLSVHKSNSDYPINSPNFAARPLLPRLRSVDAPPKVDYRTFAFSSPTKVAAEAIPSCRVTPSRIPLYVKSPKKPTIKDVCGYCHGQDPDDFDVHSTHGVPYILPFRHCEPDSQITAKSVSKWLESVETELHIADSCNSSPSLKSNVHCTRNNAKGKENVPPSSSLGDANETDYLKNVSTKPKIGSRLPVGPSRTLEIPRHKETADGIPRRKQKAADPVTKGTPPTGLLLKPPRRMGTTPKTTESWKAFAGHDSKISDSTLRRIENLAPSIGLPNLADGEGILKLSPSVTQHRRGRKAERRADENKAVDHRGLLATDIDQDLARSLQEYEAVEEG